MAGDEQVPKGDETGDIAVDRMVAAVETDWTVREATEIDDGGNLTVALAVDTGDGVRECVLKATDDESGGGNLAAEAKLLRLLGGETTVPVPEVYGVVDGQSDLSTPFFLMERADGAPLPADASEIPDDEMADYARQVGRALAEVHDLDAFDGFGPVVDAGRADTADLGGTRPLAREYELALDDPRDSWEAQLAATAERMLDGLADGRFDDIVPDLRAAIDRRQRRLDLSGSPVLARIDHNLGNLAVNRESQTVTGLLDWGLARTTDPEYDLACAEQGLCGLTSLDSKRRGLIRSALYEGYRAVGRLPDDAAFEARRRLYVLVFHAANMNWVSGWITPDIAEEVEREFREFVAEVV
ncbi:phosphotransferase [Halosimplex litoreum]|uniref:Phosphotransferase n=1 Tax=Halosimplex litoreum TaxID=1198301 RepID=A0A7T3KWR5_9EURY|nr:phosphotransferase [Halosimplex litoreum]QPV64434.1 phosphotransferase [Halosimplex litoreum]